MTAVELPSYFEHMKTRGDSKSYLWPITYDSRARQFHIGSKSVQLTEFDPYEFSPDALGLEETDLEITEMALHPLMIPDFGSVIGGPKLHNWAARNPEHASREGIDAMYEALTSLVDGEGISKEADGHTGFDLQVRNQGALNLQVWGNCACLGVNLEGLLVVDGMEKGYAQYDLHNADTQAQRASLYAGIGHLARLAS
jgi:hypothetical protein